MKKYIYLLLFIFLTFKAYSHTGHYKGVSKKLVKKRRKLDTKKVFYNQLTLHVYYINKIVNVKLFNNGNIQMTGLRDTSHVQEIILLILNIL